jgi:hypothetical protein
MIPKTQLRRFETLFDTYEERFKKLNMKQKFEGAGNSKEEQEKAMNDMRKEIAKKLKQFSDDLCTEYKIKKEFKCISDLSDADDHLDYLIEGGFFRDMFPLAQDDDDVELELPADKAKELERVRKGFMKLLYQNSFVVNKKEANEEFLKKIEKYFDDSGMSKFLIASEV